MESAQESVATVDLGGSGNGASQTNIPEETANENGQQRQNGGGCSRDAGQQHQQVMVMTDSNDAPLRQGTISSARFNILCTMVGGGCLSLPMALQKTGNGFFGPVLLVLTAVITEFCFRIIIAATRRLSPVNANAAVIGKDSFETLASAAFGTQGFLFAKWLTIAMCFFGAVGYAVLLRDMLQPITDAMTHHKEHVNGTTSFYDYYYTSELAGGEEGGGPSWASNLTMLTVILIITPVCTLKNLSSLDKLGAASMSSILILGGCIVYRSLQCNLGHSDESFDGHTWKPFKLWPDSAKDVLDAFPLFVSCYVCHYNIPAVHNELQNPTPERVNWWLRSTTVSASLFYMMIGLAGSAYGHCTPTGKVHGNVLLDFDEDDPLLLIARMCLACTITIAFPLLVIPARDILLRSWFATSTTTTTVSVTTTTHHSSSRRPARPTTTATATSTSSLVVETDTTTTAENSLREPLLSTDDNNNHEEHPLQDEQDEEGSDTVTTRATATAAARSIISQPQQHSFAIRLGTAILVLWSAAAVASCVKSIDVVWDLLGSSLSILLSYLIPTGSFIIIMGQSTAENDMDDDDDEEGDSTNGSGDNNNRWKRKGALLIAKVMICAYIPLMVISTANAFYDNFLH